MRVRLQRDTDVGMAQPFRHHFRMDATGQEQGRMAMPHAVEGDAWHAGCLAQAHEAPVDIRGLRHGSELRGKDKIVRLTLPERSSFEPLFELTRSLHAQGRHAAVIKGDTASATLRLWFLKAAYATTFDQALPYMQDSL